MSANFHVPYELRMRYLTRKNEELEVCRAQVARREFDAVKTLAHQMRGNAVSFDFPLLEQLGVLLEKNIEAGDVEGTKVLLSDIQRAISGFIQRLENTESPVK
jgi:HPt (histidine-containing phosphotransfer) domain-containing protein